jgi:hypothetical protein
VRVSRSSRNMARLGAPAVDDSLAGRTLCSDYTGGGAAGLGGGSLRRSQ